MTPDVYEQIVKVATDHTPGSWSGVAIALIGVLGLWLSKRGGHPNDTNGLIFSGLLRRTQELERGKDAGQRELAKAREALAIATRALDRAENEIRDRNEEITQLKFEVNEQLRLRNQPDRYDADGGRILITPPH